MTMQILRDARLGLAAALEAAIVHDGRAAGAGARRRRQHRHLQRRLRDAAGAAAVSRTPTSSSSSGRGSRTTATSRAAGDYLDWVRLSQSFQGLHAWSGGRVSLSSERPIRAGARRDREHRAF